MYFKGIKGIFAGPVEGVSHCFGESFKRSSTMQIRKKRRGVKMKRLNSRKNITYFRPLL